jgi:hypothetical protein
MIKGDINPRFGKKRVLVIDGDLLFTMQRVREKWWRSPKKFIVTSEDARKVLSFLEVAIQRFDDILIGSVADENVEKAVRHILRLEFAVVSFPNEESYKAWLVVQRPYLHVAQLWRRDYTRQSVWCRDFLESIKD